MALAGGEKEIVCGILWTEKDPVTGSADAYWPSPAWEAMMMQVSAAVAATVAPETVHTSGVLEV